MRRLRRAGGTRNLRMGRNGANSMNANELGRDFEVQVGRLYKAMGFVVEADMPLAGQQVDLIARCKLPDGTRHIVLVECKYKGGNERAGNDDVFSIAHAFASARSAGLVTACAVVTTNGFTRDAKVAAAQYGIHLTTKDELLRGLVDFGAYHSRLRDQYFRDFCSNGVSWYIPPVGRADTGDCGDVEEAVNAWLRSPRRRPIALLGGYGTGKTSFCRHYAATTCDASDKPIPVVLKMRDYARGRSMKSLIRDFLEEECESPHPRFDTFWRMYAEGLILLMLDGFDEMAAHADRAVIEHNLEEIEQFVEASPNVILTCRPEFFLTAKEEMQAVAPAVLELSSRKASYSCIEIALWTPAQVETFVAARTSSLHPPAPEVPEFYLERIRDLPELADMSSRAVHLDLVVRMLPTLIRESVPITRPNLYRTYIAAEFSRARIAEHRLQLLSDADRLGIMRVIAFESAYRGKEGVDFSDARAVLARRLAAPQAELDFLTREFLSRSFLSRTGDSYAFAHKSVGEYLVASELAERLRTPGQLVELLWPCTQSLAGMTLDEFGGLSGFSKLLDALGVGTGELPASRDGLKAACFAGSAMADHLAGLRAIRAALGKVEEWTVEEIMVRELAHDVRHCIVLIVGYAELMLEDQTDADFMKRGMESMRITWRRLLYRLKPLDVVAVNRLTGNVSVAMRDEVCDIAGMLSETVKVFGRGRSRITGEVIRLRGDTACLERVFENAVINAVEAMPRDGVLEIAVSLGADGSVDVTFENVVEKAVALDAEGVFLLGTSTKKGGSGLGLSSVLALVGLHEGSVCMRCEHSRAILRMSFPASRVVT